MREDVSEHFANVYERMYNSVDDKEEMSRMYSRVNKSMDTTSLSDVDLQSWTLIIRTKVNFYISTITPLPPSPPPPPSPNPPFINVEVGYSASTFINIDIGGGGKVGLSGNQCPRL